MSPDCNSADAIGSDHLLVMAARKSARIIDSQAVKSTEADGPRGYAAEKMIKGRKRHIVTDTMSLRWARR